MSDEPAPATTEVTEPSTNVVQEEEDPGHKVFVGNLSFQTSEEELAAFFAPAGTVLKANIITRGSRSLGYGFVAFATLEEAEKATSELDKKELGGREINVEVAKPKAEGEGKQRSRGEGSSRGRPFRRGRGRGRGGSRNRGHYQGPRRFTRPRGTEAEGDNQGDNNATSTTNTTEKEGAQPKSNNDDGWGQPENTNNTQWNGQAQWRDNKQTTEAKESGEAKETKKRRPTKRFRGGARARRGPRPSIVRNGEEGESAEHGQPSKTTVFVANLPFSTDDDGLKALFSDYKIKSAHVVKRHTGRSKGFGFVDLVDEEEQKKVLEGMKGARAEDRELIIKVALSEPHVQEKESPASTTNAVADAPVTTDTPAAATTEPLTS